MKQSKAQKSKGAKAQKFKYQSSVGQRHPVRATTDSGTNAPALYSQIMPYDRHLLERARTQWQFGDWESLVKITPECLEHHGERAQLALLVAAGHTQQGHTEQARVLVRQALAWGANRGQAAQLLISGVHNSLGRAAAIQGCDVKALSHFDASLGVGQPSGALELLANARALGQLAQVRMPARSAGFGLPRRSPTQPMLTSRWYGVAALLRLAERLQDAEHLQEAEAVLLDALGQAPSDPDLLAAAADNAMRRADFCEAARRWQDLAAVLGPETPQRVYNQLGAAHALMPGFGGSEEENHCWGDRPKHTVLAEIHHALMPALYLEIGVDQGVGLALAQCPAIGIDPRPALNLKVPLADTARVITASSDAFFRDQAATVLTQPLDLVFIDGMHLFEFALRDFMNVERHAHPATLVVIDDIHPCHPVQAMRRRCSTAWTGDVWKLHRILKEERPDLVLIDLNADTTGLLLIAGLDPENRHLYDHYDRIVARHGGELRPPSDVLERQGVLSSEHPLIHALLATITKARKADWDTQQTRQALRLLFEENPRNIQDRSEVDTQ